MISLFRTRPSKLKTIKEIEAPYLWFSRPTSYSDTKDANVFAFATENESIENALDRLFESYHWIAKKSAKIGICCFTERIPTQFAMNFYPGARNGLVIEYDKTILEKYFSQKFGLGDCFKKIEYKANPTLFETTSGENILWEESKGLKTYKGLLAIMSDVKLTDQLFLKMFTRINRKYRYQKESRIILAGRNIPDESDGLLGYEIQIPKESIKCIHLHRNCKTEIRNKISQLGYNVVQMSR